MLAKAIPEAAEGDTFVVHLMKPMGKQARVSSVELILPDMRNRYSFKDGRAIEDVFLPDIAGQLKDALGAINDENRLISMPDFVVTVPGLVLTGLRILLSRAEDGAETIMMRFRQYIGAIKSAFVFDPSMTIETPTMRERIAVEVLRDIVTPMFDILALREHGSDRSIEENAAVIKKGLSRIALRQDELTFYTGLLQRYVAGCRSDAEHRGLGDDQRKLSAQ